MVLEFKGTANIAPAIARRNANPRMGHVPHLCSANGRDLDNGVRPMGMPKLCSGPDPDALQSYDWASQWPSFDSLCWTGSTL